MKKSNPKTVLITGANGFIGKNLTVRLGELDDVNVIKFLRDDDIELLDQLLPKIDLIFHLAGENRPINIDQFLIGNKDFTKIICDAVERSNKQIPIIFTSSIQATLDNPYGKSKFEAEKLLEKMSQDSNIPTLIYRIPGVFGKWSRPNYNSVVATFCYNISRDIPITVNDPDKNIELIYIDDLIDMLICDLQGSFTGFQYKEITNTYNVNLQTLSETLHSFKNSRNSLISERVGSGFNRALYATYISNLPLDSFTYDVAMHGDERGVFVEMLKTKDTGQFSFFYHTSRNCSRRALPSY
jgi:UDP-2-acetamido-2,6-beta-L-arabino-hexul-4-ose reductase